MTADEFRDAYEQGRAAALRGEPATANPYRPRRVHVLAPPPRPRDQLRATAWLTGWQSQIGTREAAPHDDPDTRGPDTRPGSD